MLKLNKLKMPMPVTINDCLLLWQLGYKVEINDGRVTAVAKDKKKSGLNCRTKLPKQSITNIEPEVNYFRGKYAGH